MVPGALSGRSRSSFALSVALLLSALCLLSASAAARVSAATNTHDSGAISAESPAAGTTLGARKPTGTVPVSTTVLSSSPNPSTYGQLVTLAATVRGSNGPTPTGNVTFRDGLTVIGTVALDATQVATLTTAALTAGTHSLSATYNGDGVYPTSSSSLTQTVNKSGSVTNLTSSSNPSVFGQPVTFTATVTAVAPGAGVPTGTVTFVDVQTTLGTRTLNAAGVATFTTSTLSVGSHSIFASYGGDSNFNPSGSSTLSQIVNRAQTLSAVTSSANPADFGQPVTFTAVVSPIVPGAGVPTGTVTFRDGAAILGTRTLVSGQATLTTSTLSSGTHSISVVYSGDTNFNPSTSAPLTQTVVPCQKPAAVKDLSIAPSRANVGDVYQLSWTDTLGTQPGQYEISISTDGGASYHALAYTRTAAFAGSVTHPSGTIVSFIVRANPFCSQGTGSFSDPSNAVTLTVTGVCPKPSPPAVSIDKSSVAPGEAYALSWTPTLPIGLGGPAGQYRILQAIGAGAAFASIGVTANTFFTGSGPAAPSGTPIFLQVRAEPSCSTGPESISNPSNAVTFSVAGCAAPGVPTGVTVTSAQSPGSPPNPTDYILVTWSDPTSGTPAARHGVRINGDPEVSTTSLTAILPPRGDRLDPITAFVRAYACSPEQASPVAQSDTVALQLTAPSANFTSSAGPSVGVPVTFTDASSPQATSWLWIFDDGTTDTHQSTSHIYTTPGPHTVFLIASNGAGSSAKPLTVNVLASAASTDDRLVATAAILFDSSDPERRRASVRLGGESAVWLTLRTDEAFETVLFLRFVDASGNLVRERRLSVAPGREARYDLAAYGLSGEYALELVGAQKFEAAVVETRRPHPKEVRR